MAIVCNLIFVDLLVCHCSAWYEACPHRAEAICPSIDAVIAPDYLAIRTTQ